MCLFAHCARPFDTAGMHMHVSFAKNQYIYTRASIHVCTPQRFAVNAFGAVCCHSIAAATATNTFSSRMCLIGNQSYWPRSSNDALNPEFNFYSSMSSSTSLFERCVCVNAEFQLDHARFHTYTHTHTHLRTYHQWHIGMLCAIEGSR